MMPAADQFKWDSCRHVMGRIKEEPNPVLDSQTGIWDLSH
jgi:hypothetical protein